MNASRRRASRVLLIALGFSLLVHAMFLPFVHAPTAARAAQSQTPTVFRLRYARPQATPRPTPVPRPKPKPRVAVAAAVSRRVHVVAVVPPSAHAVSPSHASGIVAHTGGAASGVGDASGEPQAPSEPQSVGLGEATAAAPAEETPSPLPEPTRRECPGEPHDATVTQAVTPDRPRSAEEEGAVGRVVVEVEIARDGSVARAKLHATSGYLSLDTAAVAAAASARYAPASDGCEAIAGTYLYVVDFSE